MGGGSLPGAWNMPTEKAQRDTYPGVIQLLSWTVGWSPHTTFGKGDDGSGALDAYTVKEPPVDGGIGVGIRGGRSDLPEDIAANDHTIGGDPNNVSALAGDVRSRECER